MTQIEEKPGVSQFWSGLVKVKEVFYKFFKRIVVSGNKTRFWEDVWHNGKPLSEDFPCLFSLSMNHNITVQKVVSSFGGCLFFRRRLWGDLAREWCKLLDIIHGTNLSPGDDRVSWSLSDKGFSVKSLYNKLQTRIPVKVFSKMWELKVLAKVKCFMWSLMWGKTLTKMNLLKRGWASDKQCMFCASDESIDHLFFACPLARFVWGLFQCAFDTPKQPQNMCEVNIW
jgi:hypothetical protein